MRIVVCVKHVPDAEVAPAIGADGRLVRGEDDVLNELDENALEAAVSAAEEIDEVEVLALSMGPEDAEDALRRALQMGADAAYHLCDERLAGADVIATARALAAAIRQLEATGGPIDLVITGLSSQDAQTGLLPAALAGQLRWPVVSAAAALEITPTAVKATRRVDNLTSQWQVQLPAVVSVTDQANEPRYPNFRAMQAAKTKPLTTWELADLEVDEPTDLGAARTAVQVVAATQKPARSGGEVYLDAGNGGKQLAEWLLAHGYGKRD